MTFDCFKTLWKTHVTDCLAPDRPITLTDHGTPRVNAELVKLAEGKPSAFDDMDGGADEADFCNSH